MGGYSGKAALGVAGVRGGAWRLASMDGWDVGTRVAGALSALGMARGSSIWGCDVGTWPSPLLGESTEREGTGLAVRLVRTVSGRRCQNSSSSRASIAFLDAASSLGVSPRLGIGALKVQLSPPLSLLSSSASSKLSLLSSDGDPGGGRPLES